MRTKKVVFAVLAVIMLLAFASAALAESVTLTGMVESSEDGPMLNTGDMSYILDGDDMDSWVGKNVTVTGTVEEGSGDAKNLIVESIEEAE